MKAYSVDLRERVLAAVAQGRPHAEVARVFRVSLASIGRYARLGRSGGSLAAKAHPGMTPRIGIPEREALRDQLAAAGADASLAEHCTRWQAAHGVKVSVATMSRAVGRLAGWTRKKRV